MGSEQKIVLEAAGPQRHLLTVEDFLTLDEAGAFDGLGHVELIEGEIFVMSPVFASHAEVLINLSTDMTNAVRALSTSLRTLSPVSARLDLHSLPEPDLLVIDKAGLGEKLVPVEAVRLVVEVSASSLGYDLGRKLPMYARAGVPEYWVADVAGRRIIRFHAPLGGAYAERAEFAFGETIASATIPDLAVGTSFLP